MLPKDLKSVAPSALRSETDNAACYDPDLLPAIAPLDTSQHLGHQGADLIGEGVFFMELDPFQLAVGCYPILQIALYIYMAGDLPLAITVAPIVEAAKVRIGAWR